MRLGKYEHTLRLFFLGTVLALTYLAILIPAGFLEGPRIRSYDSYCRLRNALFHPPSELQEILLVTIDEESQRKMGKKWPWDRSLLAEFLNRLSIHRPKLVLFDLVLSGTSEPAHDAALAAAIRKGPPLLLACYLDQYGDPVFPLSLFTEAGGMVGLINKPRDVDLTVRKLFAGIRIPMHRQPIYAVEVQAAALARGVPLESLRLNLRSLALGTDRVPLEIPSALSINYWVNTKDVHPLPFWKVLQGPLDDPSRMRDKIVLLGSVSEITHDVYPTPLGLMPGVVISANGTMTLLSGRFVHPLPLPLTLLLGILLVTSILLVTYGMPPLRGFFAAIAFTLGGVLAGFLGLAALGYRTEYISILILGASAWLCGVFYKYLLLLSEAMRLQRQVITDPISGLTTSRYFRLRLETIRKGTSRPMSLLAVQTDPPAELLQHLEWSEVHKRIQALGEVLQRLKPRNGLAGRLSEDRFAVLLPGVTLEQAKAWGERLQQELGAAAGPLSLGLACTQQEGIHGASTLVRAAEAAATRARVKAKNRSLLEIFNPQQDKPIPGQLEPSEAAGPSDLGYVSGEIEERGRALEKALEDLRKAHRQMEENFLEVTKAFVLALETKDEYTAGHLERVSRYSARLAEVLGLPREEIEAVREAALLHDIGKIGLPDETLHKVGPLTEEEKGILKQHLSMGARILEPMKFFKPITALIYHHHERYDGKGYPHGLTGEFIPAGAQLIAIADAFDAMTTHRGYNQPRTVQEALAEIRRGSGTQFNPTYVDEFVQLIEREGVQLAGHPSL